MSDKAQIQRIIGNMKRSVSVPLVRQRLEAATALEAGEEWLAYTEAKVKDHLGDVAVTNRRLILLSEGAVLAALPHQTIDAVSIESREQAHLMGFFHNMGDFQAEVLLPTKEQAQAVVELIAEARGTLPHSWPQVYPKSRGGCEIIVPLGPPFVKLDKKPKRDILNGRASIKFPYQCAWCGSEQVTAARLVHLFARNPRYTSGLGRAAKQVTGLAVGGALGGVAGAAMGGAILGPRELEKIKGVALHVTVPHCADHTDTPPAEAVSLLSADLNSAGTSLVRVRDAEYARAIAQANMGQFAPWQPAPPDEEVDQGQESASDILLYLPTLRGLMWPDGCIVCGAPDAGQCYQPEVVVTGSVKMQNDDVQIPICEHDLKRFKRSNILGCVVPLLGLPIALALGWLTLALVGNQAPGLARWGVALAVAVASYAGVLYTLTRVAKDKLGVNDLGWKPVGIKLEDGHYLLEFCNAKMAEATRQANNLA